VKEDALKPELRKWREAGRGVTEMPAMSASGEWTTVEPWYGGLTFDQAVDEEERSWTAAELLWDRFAAHPAFGPHRQAGKLLFRELREAFAETCGGTPPGWAPLERADRYNVMLGASLLRQVVNFVMGRNHPVFDHPTGGKLTPDLVVVEVVGPFRQQLQTLSMDCLNDLGEPRDEWHQAAALAYLLEPDLALFAVQYQYWHPPPGPGQGDKERQVHTAVGAQAQTERNATKAKLDFRRRSGAVSHRRRPGPKAGSHNQTNPLADTLDAYLLAQKQKHVSNQGIAQDAEAWRLYRQFKDDYFAELTERTVAARLRGKKSRR
jgi:hypothetical protein